jgi:hypothetical protein
MSLAEFFTLDLSASPQVFYRGDELTDLGDRHVSLRLVAAHRPNRSMSARTCAQSACCTAFRSASWRSAPV